MEVGVGVGELVAVAVAVEVSVGVGVPKKGRLCGNEQARAPIKTNTSDNAIVHLRRLMSAIINERIPMVNLAVSKTSCYTALVTAALSEEGAFCCEAKMRSVSWDPSSPAVKMIDQRLLPHELKIIELRTVDEVVDAIRSMAVRGAPAIGATAAYGLALAAVQSAAEDPDQLRDHLERAAAQLADARPTAVNLRWALSQTMDAVQDLEDTDADAMRSAIVSAAQALADADVDTNLEMAAFGAGLLPDPSTVLHHCNTGALATVDHGTALGVIRTAYEQGKRIHVLVDETRPRLQGSRLTAWELQQAGISFDIITDSAAGFHLASGEVDAVLVGADRVAANGDIANKIGTYMLALAAHDNQVPFYCVAPISTFDLTTPSGEDIPIEVRDPAEVLDLSVSGKPTAPAGSSARNPAFDITPHRLVTAFITERGVLQPPFEVSIKRAVLPEDIS